ncbi:MAG: thioesterase, partial [Ignavibacteriaceae bacterium]|nr:thioesterase [Ignavibacteriaceae bacterium]
MARIKIDPPEKFMFNTEITIRVTDLNYGAHLGNDSVLSICHEARMRFLKHFGYSELDI